MRDLEKNIVKYFNKIGDKKLDMFLGFINSISFLAFFWTALVAIAVLKHPEITNKFLILVALVAVLHFAITEGIIKHLFAYFIGKRKRPYVQYPDQIRAVGRKFSDSSFPSSHMATTVAMLFVITEFYPSLIFPAILFVLIMAFSRLHNGMHYPSDVFVGIILGSSYGWLAFFFVKFF